jgi:hypothetical protein
VALLVSDLVQAVAEASNTRASSWQPLLRIRPRASQQPKAVQARVCCAGRCLCAWGCCVGPALVGASLHPSCLASLVGSCPASLDSLAPCLHPLPPPPACPRQVAGYTVEYAQGLSYATVKGAGAWGQLAGRRCVRRTHSSNGQRSSSERAQQRAATPHAAKSRGAPPPRPGIDLGGRT